VPVLVRVGVGVEVNVFVPTTAVTIGVAVKGTACPAFTPMHTLSIQ
jgi:hypothetical protein